MKRFLGLFIIFSICLSASETSFANKVKPNPNATREILLPTFQYNQLKQDLPAKHILMDSNKTLWVTGKKSIWRWQTKDNTLKKIPLIFKNDTDRLKKLIINNEQIYVLSEKGLFQLKFDPLRAVKLRTKNSSQHSVDLAAVNDKIYWITNNKVYTVDHSSKKLKTLSFDVDLSKLDKIIFNPQDQLLWQVRPKSIVLHSYKNGTEKRVLKKTKYKIRNIRPIGNEVYVSTRYTVLRFDKDGRLLQSIPVENGRKLILMEQNTDKHLYLFSDKLLEVYNTASNESLKYNLNLGKVRKARMITSFETRVGLLLDGIPRVFQLSGKS